MKKLLEKIKEGIFKFLIAPSAALFLFNCGQPNDPAQPLEILAQSGGVQKIYFNGVPIFGESVAGYFIIGNCTGSDDENNLFSLLDEGDGMMSSDTGLCQKVPYSFKVHIKDEYKLVTEISVGPAPEDGRKYSFSVPFEASKDIFESFEFGSVWSYELGCGDSYIQRFGNRGLYQNIPTQCVIPDLGNVGLARAKNASYIEINGAGIKIKRKTFVEEGCIDYYSAYNHPSTNNTEVGFGDCSNYHKIREEIEFSNY